MSIYPSVLARASTAVLATVSLMALAQTATAPTFKSSPQAKSASQSVQSRSNRLIVKFREDADGKNLALDAASGRERITALNNLTMPTMANGVPALSYLRSVSPYIHVAHTSQSLNPAEMQTLIQAVTKDPRVEFAEVDERVYPHFLPNDSFYQSQQWSLKSPVVEPGGVNLPNAWGRMASGVPVSGAGVTVAVVDTGYRPHADLAVNLVPGYDFVGPDGPNDFTTANDGDGRDASALDPGDWNTKQSDCDVEDSSWHGTHIAGVIAAVGNNNAGVIGVAYRAKILPVRVLGVCGGYTSDTAAGLQWAAGLTVPGVPANANVAKVINLSFGRSGSCSQTYQAAVTAARNAGSVIVVSTGNDYSKSNITQPSNCAGVIAVTAHSNSGANTDYANTGPGTSISAPGNNIYTTSNTGTTTPDADSYDARSGTSFSAPHVAGVAALLLQIKPGISPSELQTYLMNSARPYPSGTFCSGRSDCGAGLLDAFRAVQTLLQAQGIANSAPAINSMATQYVLPGGSLQFTITGTDADGDELSFLGGTLPPGASFNPVTGAFIWTKAQPAGDYVFSVQATDGATVGASTAIRISVTATIPAVPVTPVVSPTPVSSGGGGSIGWLDLLAGLMLLVATAWVRKPVPSHKTRQQDGQ